MAAAVLKSPIWILFLVSLILEVVGLILMLISLRSICIVAYEVSNGAMIFGLFIFTAILPDLIYVISIIFMQDLGKEPLGIVYNLVIGIGCLTGSIAFIILLTFCGNIAQFFLLGAAVLGILSGIVHIANSGISHWLLPGEESYRTPRQTDIQKK